MTLMLVFVPKFWYQQKQVRSLAQEYSCRIPVDAFKVRVRLVRRQQKTTNHIRLE
jgi:hypothetical protein